MPYRSRRHWDAFAGTEMQVMAVAGTPSLRDLVWSPVWSQGGEEDFKPGGYYHAAAHRFREDLMSVFDLRQFTILLPGESCVRFVGPEEPMQVVPDPAHERERRWESGYCQRSI